jgi:hypothetical protein
MSNDELKEREEKAKTLENAGLAGAAAEVVQRFGSANKEFLVGYGGVDNETGQKLSKSLKDITESKVNPDYRDNNIHQQAGFSAEVESNSRKNAENIINKKNVRNTRTDDIEKQIYGKNQIGGKNDQLYDHVELDANGKPIAGTAAQLKFVGKGGEDTLNKLVSKDYDKYFENDAPIEIPSDYYDGVRKAAGKQAQGLQKQIDRLKENSPENQSTIDAKEKQLKKLESIRDGKSIRKSNVSSKEAIFARLHPRLTTAWDIAEISHRAGVEQAKMGAAISGGMSLVRNIVAVVKGEKAPDEAALSAVKDTGTGAAASYAIAFAGSVIKGGMQNAQSAVTRGLSRTNLPAAIVTTTLEMGKTLAKYFKGEIDGVECLTELGEKGTGMVSSAMFATIGQIAIPIPVVGAMIGSMLGYALSSACYGQLVSALNAAKLACEERIRIEAERTEAIKMIHQYRAEMERRISEYLVEHITVFHAAFDGIKGALQIGDIDGFIAGANAISAQFGSTPKFSTFCEFEQIMNNREEVFVL